MPTITYTPDSQMVTGNRIAGSYLQYLMPLAGENTCAMGEYLILSDEIPDSFIAGMREIKAGLAIDFDVALKTPPVIE